MTLPAGIFNPGLPGSLPGGGGGGDPTPTPATTNIITQPTLLIQFDDEQCTAFSDNSNPTGPLGRTVTLTAVPKPGFVFGKWNFTDISPPTPTTTPTPTPDPRINVTIKWNGTLSGARTENGEFVKRLRIGTNPGNVTQVDTDVTFASNGSPGQFPTSISALVLPGTEMVLSAEPGFFNGQIIRPDWFIEGGALVKNDSAEVRPTVGSQDVTYVASFAFNL